MALDIYVITEWDGTEEQVEVLEGPQRGTDLDSDHVRIRYSDGVVHEVRKTYFRDELKPQPIH